MIQYAIETGICWTLFLVIYWFFFRKETYFVLNRSYLLASLLLGILIPMTRFISFTVGHDSSPLDQYLYAMAMTKESMIEIVETSMLDSVSYYFRWALMVIYLVGVVFLTIRFLHGLSRIYLLYANGEKTEGDEHVLVATKSIHLPFSFFKWVFVSKKVVLTDDMNKVLKHELFHVKRWHSVDVILIEIIQIIFWFNPILIIYKKEIKQTHEYLADASVIKDSSTRAYGQLLLRQSTSGLEIALANHFFQSHFKNRILMMYKQKSNKSVLFRYLLLIPVIAFVAILFSSSIISGCTEQDEQTIKTKNRTNAEKDKIYTIVDKKPRFPGCENQGFTGTDLDKCSQDKMLMYIYKNLKYPKKAKEKGIEGQVVLQFTVTKQGAIEDIDVVRDIGGTCGEASKKVVESMNNMVQAWTPGYVDGQTVNVQYTLPVRFKLADNYNSDMDKIESEKPIGGFINTRTNVKKTPEQNKDGIYTIVDKKPRFPGCENQRLTGTDLDKCSQDKMLMYIYKNLKYPNKAKENGIEGQVVLQFTVTKQGVIEDIDVVRDIGGTCGEASKKVVESMNYMGQAWIPGYVDGKAVDVQYTLPVRFKLASDDSDDETKKH